ncbi:uncharacterized protein LOC125500942 [Athalia rosae]|uniref:uncharacterized protein LOC125500942 n=1 Tax=Athalia rosae TaxID=37344 RepID=UPI0020335A0D|nr:uncharacterized protein LOC125500942 [Athalia rosae]
MYLKKLNLWVQVRYAQQQPTLHLPDPMKLKFRVPPRHVTNWEGRFKNVKKYNDSNASVHHRVSWQRSRGTLTALTIAASTKTGPEPVPRSRGSWILPGCLCLPDGYSCVVG